MTNVLGKTKKEPFSNKMAKELAVEVAHKRFPMLPKKQLRKAVEKTEKMGNKKKKGIGL